MKCQYHLNLCEKDGYKLAEYVIDVETGQGLDCVCGQHLAKIHTSNRAVRESNIKLKGTIK